jgi:multidrug resistance efflux pump
LLAGSRPEEVDATQAEINRLTAQQTYLNEQLRHLPISSPIRGIITTHKLKEKIGQSVKKGDLIAEVNDLTAVIAEIAVPEKDIADIKVGQPIILKARAYPGRSFDAKVVSIAPIAGKVDDTLPDSTVRVTTTLDNSGQFFKPEMTGNAKIFCGTYRLYEVVFRRLVRFVRVEFWSWW